MGRPDQSKSHVVVCPFVIALSSARSARKHRLICSYLLAFGVKRILEGSTPLFAASLNRFYLASAGYSSSQSILSGTRLSMFIQRVKVDGSIL